MIGFTYLGISAVVLPKFPASYLVTDEFGNDPFWWRLVYFNFAIILIRIRYYAGWLMIQTACSATGITYNHESHRFD